MRLERKFAKVRPLKSDGLIRNVAVVAVEADIDERAATATLRAGAAVMMRLTGRGNLAIDRLGFQRGPTMWEWLAARCEPRKGMAVLVADALTTGTPSPLVLTGMALWSANAGWEAPTDTPLILSDRALVLPLQDGQKRRINVQGWEQLMGKSPPAAGVGERADWMARVWLERRRMVSKHRLGPERQATVAANSYASFKRRLPEGGLVAHDLKAWLHVERNAYRGGLIGANRTGRIGKASYADLNAAYLSMAAKHVYPWRPAKIEVQRYQGMAGLKRGLLEGYCAIAPAIVIQTRATMVETRPTTESLIGAIGLGVGVLPTMMEWRENDGQTAPSSKALGLMGRLLDEGLGECNPLMDTDRPLAEGTAARPVHKSFLTVLTTRELARCLSRSWPEYEILALGRIRWYAAGPVLAEWAKSMTALRDDVGDDLRPWAKMMSAFLHGKFGMKAAAWMPVEPRSIDLIGIPGRKEYVDGKPCKTLHGTAYRLEPVGEELAWAQPGLAAHLTADCRMALDARMRLATSRGGSVFYHHTDGFLTDPRGIEALMAEEGVLGGKVGEMSVESHKGVVVHGSQGWSCDCCRPHIAGHWTHSIQWHSYCGLLTDVARGTRKGRVEMAAAA